MTWPLRRLWRAKWGAAYLIIFIGSLFILPSESARLSTQDYRYDANSVQLAGVPKRDVAIVLGGGDTPDNKPADYLRQRIVTAANLYKADRVEAIIMSGDNRNQQYNEPLAMKEHALRLGIPAEDILIDNAGYSTYDSCQRAKSVLQVSSATVITQGYHLPRAVMTCRDQGIDAVGLAAHRTGRDWTVVYLIREQLSTAKAFARTIF